MDYKIVYVPPFKAVSSGLDKEFDFSEDGILGKFNNYFSKLKPKSEDNFSPRDYLYYDSKNQGMVWIYALTDYMNTEGFETFDFDGGNYLIYEYIDGDDERREELYNIAMDWIKSNDKIELDERENHYSMGHIITPRDIIDALGHAYMRAYIPVKIKNR